MIILILPGHILNKTAEEIYKSNPGKGSSKFQASLKFKIHTNQVFKIQLQKDMITFQNSFEHIFKYF